MLGSCDRYAGVSLKTILILLLATGSKMEAPCLILMILIILIILIFNLTFNLTFNLIFANHNFDNCNKHQTNLLHIYQLISTLLWLVTNSII